MAKYSTSAIILICGVFAVIVFLIYSYFTNPLHAIAAGMPVLAMIFLFSTGMLGEYTGFVLKNKNFLTAGGGIGVVRDVNYYTGGNVGYVVTTWNRTRGIKKRIRKGNALEGFFTFFSITTTIEIIDKVTRFHDLEEHLCDLKEGTVFYEGTFSGVDVPSKYDYLKTKIDYLYSTLTKAHTIFEKAKSIAAASAQEANVDMLESIKKMEIAVKGVASALKPRTPQRTIMAEDRTE